MDWPKCNDSACSGRVDPNTLRCDTCDKSVRHPTPSITVGTQVRLTGVVKGPTHKETGAVGIAIDGCPGGFSNTVLVLPARLEVIRQPFKRGEVVYLVRPENVFEEYPRLVKDDELKGNVTVIDAEGNIYTRSSQDFERRP